MDVQEVGQVLFTAPSYTGGHARLLEDGLIAVTATTTQRDLQRSIRRTAVAHSVVRGDKGGVLFSSIPVDLTSSAVISAFSPTGTQLALIRSVSSPGSPDQFYLEVWCNDARGLQLSVPLQAHHGAVYSDKYFATLTWDQRGSRVAYIAERPAAPAVTDSFVRPKFTHRRTWGDSYGDLGDPVLVLVDFSRAEGKPTVTVLADLPVSPAQPVFLPDGRLLFAGMPLPADDTTEFGILYCTNRPSSLCICNADGSDFKKIQDNFGSVRGIRPSHDGSVAVFIANEIPSPHGSTSRVHLVDIAAGAVRTLYDLDSSLFIDTLPTQCWLHDGRSFIAVNQVAAERHAIILSTEGSAPQTIPSPIKDAAVSVFDVIPSGGLTASYVLCAVSNPYTPHALYLARLEAGTNAATWSQVMSPPSRVSSMLSDAGVTLTNISNIGPHGASAFMLRTAKTPRALAVMPHGGPHSVSTTEFHPSIASYVLAGFAVLQVNYVGSLGHSDSHVHALLGHIGSLDVADVVEATIRARDLLPSPLSSRPALLYGGSHGGYLTLQLLARHSDLFAAGAARNPVVDVNTMATGTDISHWCFEETGRRWAEDLWTAEAVPHLFAASPAAHVREIKVPLMLLVGMEDRRVPPQQGMALYRFLRARGENVSIRKYPNGNHGLDGMEVEGDVLASVVAFLNANIPA